MAKDSDRSKEMAKEIAKQAGEAAKKAVEKAVEKTIERYDKDVHAGKTSKDDPRIKNNPGTGKKRQD